MLRITETLTASDARYAGKIRTKRVDVTNRQDMEALIEEGGFDIVTINMAIMDIERLDVLAASLRPLLAPSGMYVYFFFPLPRLIGQYLTFLVPIPPFASEYYFCWRWGGDLQMELKKVPDSSPLSFIRSSSPRFTTAKSLCATTRQPARRRRSSPSAYTATSRSSRPWASRFRARGRSRRTFTGRCTSCLGSSSGWGWSWTGWRRPGSPRRIETMTGRSRTATFRSCLPSLGFGCGFLRLSLEPQGAKSLMTKVPWYLFSSVNGV